MHSFAGGRPYIRRQSCCCYRCRQAAGRRPVVDHHRRHAGVLCEQRDRHHQPSATSERRLVPPVAVQEESRQEAGSDVAYPRHPTVEAPRQTLQRRAVQVRRTSGERRPTCRGSCLQSSSLLWHTDVSFGHKIHLSADSTSGVTRVDVSRCDN